MKYRKRVKSLHHSILVEHTYITSYKHALKALLLWILFISFIVAYEMIIFYYPLYFHNSTTLLPFYIQVVIIKLLWLKIFSSWKYIKDRSKKHDLHEQNIITINPLLRLPLKHILLCIKEKQIIQSSSSSIGCDKNNRTTEN